MKVLLVFAIIIQVSLSGFYLKENEFNEKIYVNTYGNSHNEAIVLVHGMGDEASTIWDRTIKKLKNDYFIVTFDLPGFGKSTKSNQLYSIERYVKFIHNITNMYIREKYHVVGHSMGGAISLKYASVYQKELKSLVLIDAAGILSKQAFSKSLIKGGLKSFFGTSIKNFNLDIKLSKIPEKIESFLPFDVSTLISSSHARKFIFQSDPSTISAMSLVNEDFSYIPEQIELPTRIIWGEDDNIAPVRTGYVLNKLIKNSKLDVIKNSKHVPIVDAFDTYIQYLKQHLNNPKYDKTLISKTREKKQNIVWENIDGGVLSGDIERMELTNCKNIIIKDARIKQLSMYNSRVEIFDSSLLLYEKSYFIDSKLEITSSNIFVNTPIDLYKSNLDFAGVNILTKENLFENFNTKYKQTIIFSLSKYNIMSMHGEYLINKDNLITLNNH